MSSKRKRAAPRSSSASMSASPGAASGASAKRSAGGHASPAMRRTPRPSSSSNSSNARAGAARTAAGVVVAAARQRKRGGAGGAPHLVSRRPIKGNANRERNAALDYTNGDEHVTLSPHDVHLRTECAAVRYALAKWASIVYAAARPRARSEECLVRDTMRERLQHAVEESLATAEREQGLGAAHLDAAFHARTVERVLFWRWYYLQPAMYRQRCRQMEFNLTRNGWYLLTHFGPLTICSFPTHKLAEETAVAKWRVEHRQRLLHDLKPPTPQVVEKGLFQCRQCHGWRTTYYALQTRGADEPMTNFVTCHDCGSHFRRS